MTPDRSPGADRDDPTDTDPVDSFTDPAALREREGVPYREERREVDEATFEAAADVEGQVVVGVVEDGSVLLTHLGEGHGWGLPGGLIRGDADWVGAARRGVEDRTGVPVAVTGVERVTRLENVHDGRATVTHDVVLRGVPATGADPPADPDAVADDAAWFDDLPDDAHAPGDVRPFLD